MPVKVRIWRTWGFGKPNHHAGGAEIAGNWPPGWVAYIGGALKAAGITNLRFVDVCESHRRLPE